MDVYEKIYMTWRFEALAPSYAMRGGMRRCGASRDPGPFDYEKCQSLAEHAAGMRSLVESILDESAIRPLELSDWSHDRIIMSKVASLHDSSEALLSGDIPANGTRDDLREDIKERDIFEQQLLYLPAVQQASILRVYIEFQEKSTPRGWLLYMADKTDAILTMLECAILGRAGKLCGDTKQDAYQYRVTGSFAPYECWMVPLFDDILSKRQFLDISKEFIEVITYARRYAHNVNPIIPAQLEWLPNYYKINEVADFPLEF